MSLVPPHLLDRLQRTSFVTRFAEPHGRPGERTSKQRGSGIEFLDHKTYQPGDDLRHVDRHVYARLGEFHVRQFVSMSQLNVVLFLDSSASMRFGTPPKHHSAAAVAAALAFVGLAGGDRVSAAAIHGATVRWHPPVEGRYRYHAFEAWLEDEVADGRDDVASGVNAALRSVNAPALVVFVTDAMFDGFEAAVQRIAAAGCELLLMHVIAPEEADPRRLGDHGEVVLVDAESGSELVASLDRERLKRYAVEFHAWCLQVQAIVTAVSGRYVLAQSDDDLFDLVVRRLTAGGVVR